MTKGNFYQCFYRRNHGELEDVFIYEVFAFSKKEACLLSFAALSDLYAETSLEAREKAAPLLADRLGENWTAQQFLDSGMEIWPEPATCISIHDILSPND